MEKDIEIIHFKKGTNIDKIMLSNKWFCKQLNEIGNIGHEKHKKSLVSNS